MARGKWPISEPAIDSILASGAGTRCGARWRSRACARPARPRAPAGARQDGPSGRCARPHRRGHRPRRSVRHEGVPGHRIGGEAQRRGQHVCRRVAEARRPAPRERPVGGQPARMQLRRRTLQQPRHGPGPAPHPAGPAPPAPAPWAARRRADHDRPRDGARDGQRSPPRFQARRPRQSARRRAPPSARSTRSDPPETRRAPPPHGRRA